MRSLIRQLVQAISLALILHGNSEAQVDDPAPRAYRTSLLSTAIPVVLGTAMIVASDFEGDRFVAGYVLASLGVSIGPAIGYWQQAQSAKGWTGAGGRLALSWGSVALAAAALGDCDFWTCTNDQYTTAGLILAIGHGAAALWALHDIASLRGAVFPPPRRRRPQFSLAPTYVPAARAPGLLLELRF